MVNRRDFLKYTALAGAGLAWPGWAERLLSRPMAGGLLNPAYQPKFVNILPDALSPTFIHRPTGGRDRYEVGVQQIMQQTGLIDPLTNAPLATPVWGYADKNGKTTWPGKTFIAQRGRPVTVVWTNDLVNPVGGYLPHLLPVDPNLHWAYSLPGYTGNSIAANGVPLVPHLHGGHTEWQSDGNPEFFFSPNLNVTGPRYISNEYHYDNDQRAGTLWYHDHALGITRLNVYAGLAGFYILRDDVDTGKENNPLGLPAWPYETALAIQGRMFKDTGELFYSAFPGDPLYEEFIDENVNLPEELFPGGGPTALAEFFGDHMVVNGVIWPKMDVEPRHYRLRLLNGTDSRFLVVRFRNVAAGAVDVNDPNAHPPLPFHVIGTDQGLLRAAVQTSFLIIGPGERYDVVVDFSQVPAGSRVIMTNAGADEPFGGDFDLDDDLNNGSFSRETNRIMAFDVVLPLSAVADRFNPAAIGGFGGVTGNVSNVRKVALFEGTDEFGRLQPLLGTAVPTQDASGATVNGALAWHSPTTENPALGATEEWEIYNTTGDAHPIHLHLVHFEVLSRQGFSWTAEPKQVLQHNGEYGEAIELTSVTPLGSPTGPEGVEDGPKDTVVAYPEQITRIRATFDRPGHYVWHCHILSHEDHEMMRVLHVGPGA
ncbi:MAG: multicopper oxidase domain-containing protein [Gemmatimonadota bacterium]